MLVPLEHLPTRGEAEAYLSDGFSVHELTACGNGLYGHWAVQSV